MLTVTWGLVAGLSAFVAAVVIYAWFRALVACDIEDAATRERRRIVAYLRSEVPLHTPHVVHMGRLVSELADEIAECAHHRRSK